MYMKSISKILVVAFLAISFLAACKAKQANGGTDVPTDFALTIQHTGCRGNCPAYNITVDANGAATYEGRRGVEMMGKYSKTVGKATVTELVKAIQAANFWDFEAEYGGEVADVPGITTTVVMDTKTKVVRDIRNAPQPLKDLEAKLEELIGKEGWVKQN
jgi:NADH:ubiquinone oxidoreductase subunit E